MEYKHNPPALSEVREIRKSLKPATRKEIRVVFTPLEKFAIFVTRAVGSMGFFFILTAWTIGWLLWNLYAPVQYRVDPAPAFVIWLFASNVIQLILLPLVMVGQNLEGKFADQRAQADFDVDQGAALGIEVIIAHLENQNELLLELARKIERK